MEWVVVGKYVACSPDSAVNPCPVCGGVAWMRVRRRADTIVYRLYCRDCCQFGNEGENIEKLIEVWNAMPT